MVPAAVLRVFVESDMTSSQAGRAKFGMGFWVAVSMLVVLMVLVLLPSRGHMGPSNRSFCASNLRGTTQSMNVYAADYNDAYPVIAVTGGYARAAGGGGVPDVDAGTTVRSMYAPASPSVT